MKFWIKRTQRQRCLLDRSVDQIQPEGHQLVTSALEVQSEKNEDKNHGGGRGLRKRRRKRR